MAEATWQDNLGELLRRFAQDFDEIPEDIEAGATEVRHPELLSQASRRYRGAPAGLSETPTATAAIGLALLTSRRLQLGIARHVLSGACTSQ